MKIGLSIQGGKELASAIRSMEGAASKKVVIGALKEGGDEMASVMSAFMVRGKDAPHAADNVVVQAVSTITDTDGTKRAVLPDEYAVAIGPSKNFFYWFFQEYGTVHHPPQPAMRPAFDTTVARCLDIVVATLRAAILGQAAKVGRGAGSATGGNL